MTSAALSSLVNRGLIQRGTVVGINNPASSKIYLRFLVASFSPDNSRLHVRHLESNTQIQIELDQVQEIDGMSVSRYLSHADLDDQGSFINRGKKRGRRPKHSR